MTHFKPEDLTLLRSIDERLFYQEELIVVEEAGHEPVIYSQRPGAFMNIHDRKTATIRWLTYGESFSPSIKTAMDTYRRRPVELRWEKNQDQS